MIRAAAIAATLAACLATACGNDPTAPSSTGDDTPGATTEFFVGSLDVGGSRFYSISVASEGTVNVTLASLVSAVAPPRVSVDTIALGFGTPVGTGCAVSTSVAASPALVAQLSTASAAGIHCVRVSDPGQLQQPVNFAVRIIHP
jgi:hypothetical protein